MSFFVRDDKIWEKYEQIWDVIKNKWGIKFHSEPVYDKTYIKAKVREFDGVTKRNFLGNDVPKEILLWELIKEIIRKLFRRIQIKNKENANV